MLALCTRVRECSTPCALHPATYMPPTFPQSPARRYTSVTCVPPPAAATLLAALADKQVATVKGRQVGGHKGGNTGTTQVSVGLQVRQEQVCRDRRAVEWYTHSPEHPPCIKEVLKAHTHITPPVSCCPCVALLPTCVNVMGKGAHLVVIH